MNKIDFTVSCRVNTLKNETFRVYYVCHDGKWLPLPPQICDNGCNSDACQQCVAEVVKQALQTEPPFAR